MKKRILFFLPILLVGCAQSVPVRPDVSFEKGPVKPSGTPGAETSILLGRSSAQANLNVDAFRYKPVEDGGFLLNDKTYRYKFNRSVVMGRNTLFLGDRPIFKMATVTGSGVYPHAEDRCFPLFGRDKEEQAQVTPTLGVVRLGVPTSAGMQWFDETENLKTLFRPGYVVYDVSAPDASWTAKMTVVPTLDFHGFVCKVEFEAPTRLVWTCGELAWEGAPKAKLRVRPAGKLAELTSPELPRAVVSVGCDVPGKLASKKTEDDNRQARFEASAPKKVYYVVGTWGVKDYDRKLAKVMMDRIDRPNVAGWEKKANELKKQWFECYVGRALRPKVHAADLLKHPEEAFAKAIAYWDERRAEFRVETPDPYFNAAVNFERCASEYHRLPPGLVLSSSRWVMYSHISVGWYGRLWSGDVESLADYLRLFGAMQADDGFINWVSPSLAPYSAENNGPYWVDQIWWTYQWSADKQLLLDLWPAVKKAVAREQRVNDPDADGLFGSSYEYWNCDSNGKGPKAATPTTTAWNMYRHAAKIADVVGDEETAKQYEAQAEKIRKAALRELWHDDAGLFGSIGGNGVWRGHPQTWEEYLPIIDGLLPPEKGLRAMRWLDAHYGFSPEKDVRLLMNCDWWPIRWSVHWVPVGDTLLAAQAGMKCGDADLWWPYVQTVARSSFRSDAPAIRFGISNTGSGSTEIEDVDADDPHSQIAVRGLFGIEPDLPNDRLFLAPAFPSDWTNASLRTPYVSVAYSRVGNRCTLRIETPKPTIKIVRGRVDLPEQTTQKETVSVVNYELPEDPPTPPLGPPAPQVMVESEPRPALEKLTKEGQERQILLDLSGAYNVTLKKLCKEIRFTGDCGGETTIETWWHTVPGETGDGPEIIDAPDGARFLIKGRSAAAKGKANNLIALSSWTKNGEAPLPAVARIQIGRKLEGMRLLMQNYVSPIKNYVPNGEIVLHYETGAPETIALVPPYNLDCYFQAFARKGASLPLGRLEWGTGWSTCTKEFCKAQALELPLDCDPNRTLDHLEIRATVSEGVLGLTALTLLPSP